MTLTTVKATTPAKATKGKANKMTTPPKPALPPVNSPGLFGTTLPKPSGYPIPAEVDTTLSTILSWRRAHTTDHESQFVRWLVERCTTLGYKPTYMTAENNVVVEVPRADNLKSTTLFSSHTDTCHAQHDRLPQRQTVAYDGERGEIFLKNAQAGDCLGADDGAGVWLMLEMIRSKVPGTYVFHRGEERGCIGSAAMARDQAKWLEQFDVAIAFDRKGFTEIITHQGGGKRCASDKCATALQKQLHNHGLKDMVLSDRGSLTDTLKYRGLVAECFNLAVGYYANHGPDEYVDYAYLVALRDALINVDWDALPVDRDPKAADPIMYPPNFGSSYTPAKNKYVPPTPLAKTPASSYDPAEDFMGMTRDDLVAFLESFPDTAADDIDSLLLDLVRTRAERDYYKTRGGF